MLPLPGSLPDMKAQSADYIHLQNIYKRKAKSDLAEITTRVRQLETTLNRTTPIDPKEIEAFAKNAAFVKLIRGRPLLTAQLASGTLAPHELNWHESASALSIAFHMPEDSLLPIYLAFLAYDYKYFQILDSRTKNLKAFSVPSANMALEAITVAAGLEDMGRSVLQRKIEDVLKEFERAEGAELHNIAALTGGMVAQEVIKVVTRQYVPVDNACVFDGVGSKSAVFRM
ncbi:MAG: hypothetical protein Q9164_007960 [Protoblastenia rupestris]